MAGTKGRTGFHRLTAGKNRGSGLKRGKRAKLSRMTTHNRAGGR